MSHLYPFHSISRSSSYQQWWCCFNYQRVRSFTLHWPGAWKGLGPVPWVEDLQTLSFGQGVGPFENPVEAVVGLFFGGSNKKTWSNLACTIGMVKKTTNAVLFLAGASMLWQGNATNQVDVWAMSPYPQVMVKNHLHLIPNTRSFA